MVISQRSEVGGSFGKGSARASHGITCFPVSDERSKEVYGRARRSSSRSDLIPAGCIVLAMYGFVPTLQPPGAEFARVYAVYGGIFIVLSYLWGWALDGSRPDLGDFVGAGVALTGVALAWFWPRGG